LKLDILTLKFETQNTKHRTCLCLDLPAIDYKEAWEFQTQLVSDRKSNRLDTDIFILLEHPSVFTLGRRGGLENLTLSEDLLKKTGIPVIHVERGGNITFHGPGQLIVYPIIDLRAAGLPVVEYVSLLEEIMIRTVGSWGIKAERNAMNRGIWVGASKLGSVGIAVRRGISFHGLALNVSLALKPFEWIHPCGLEGIGVTSMEEELSQNISMDSVRKAVKDYIEAVFGVKLVTTNLADLRVQKEQSA